MTMKKKPHPMTGRQTRTALHRRFALLALIAAGAASAAASETVFEDTFAQDDSVHYALEGGLWTYDAKRRAFGMEKALDRNNETMSAIRKQVALPRAFTLEAEFTADGAGGGGLLIQDPASGHYAFACLGLGEAEEGGRWVVAWIVYSYPETNWGYLRQTKTFVPDLADFKFTLQLTRVAGSDELEFTVYNDQTGPLQTLVAPGMTGDEGNELLPSWVETLNAFSVAGLRGYDSKGSWSRVKLIDLGK